MFIKKEQVSNGASEMERARWYTGTRGIYNDDDAAGRRRAFDFSTERSRKPKAAESHGTGATVRRNGKDGRKLGEGRKRGGGEENIRRGEES